MSTKNIRAFFRQVSAVAKQALIDEVNVTPKPGLVDCNNNGAHKDMNIGLFIDSANALEPYFYRFVEYGYKTSHIEENQTLKLARNIGIEAENVMYDVTDNINTHKGMIFSVGLICMAVGRLCALKKKISVDNICTVVSKTVSGISKRDFSIQKKSEEISNGEKIYKLYGIKGSRGEAESGFLTVRRYAYPFYLDCIKKEMDKNESAVRTLLYIMSFLQDTNVIKRGGPLTAACVREKCEALTNASITQIEEFDRELIEKNLSPGGAADLLAVTLLFWEIEHNL